MPVPTRGPAGIGAERSRAWRSEVPDALDTGPPAETLPTRRARIGGVVLSLAGGAAWVVLLITILVIVPRFENIYQKFDIAGGMPWMTQVVITGSRFVVRTGGIFLLPLGVVLGLCSCALCILDRRRWVVKASALAGAAFLICSVGAVVAIAIAIFRPLMDLVTHVSSGP